MKQKLALIRMKGCETVNLEKRKTFSFIEN